MGQSYRDIKMKDRRDGIYYRYMRKHLKIITGIVFCILILIGCGNGENNYDAYYQRYRFYVEDGQHFFFNETRERKDDYGPCTEKDTTQKRTIKLTDDQWMQFCNLVNGGTVKAREESEDSGAYKRRFRRGWKYIYV